MAQRCTAWVLLFLLASQQVHAVREGVEFGAAEALVASVNSNASHLAEQVSAVKEQSGFSIKTHWAVGKESSLKWKKTELTFSAVKQGFAEYIELRGMDKTYRIMPDAAVVAKKLKGMPVVTILGVQEWNKGEWKESTYAKKEALFIRAETNPVVGKTKDSLWHWRYAGYPLYEPQNRNGEFNSKLRHYYIDDSGNFYTVKEKDVDPVKAYKDKLMMKVQGKADTQLKTPDMDLAALLDGLLGHTSCLNNPSTCAFRCFYNVEEDKCGPTAFCRKFEEYDKVRPNHVSRLAPLQQHQKCVAMGSEDGHDEADKVLSTSVIEGLKKEALLLAKRLHNAESISPKQASKTSIQTTVAMWREATDLLGVFEALPVRLGEDGGRFEAAAKRAQEKDMKHWRHKDYLKSGDYTAAAGETIDEVQASTSYSVPAKLHSELVQFMLKRPTQVIKGVEQESKGTCKLSAEKKNELELFVRYYLGQPGFNPGDLKAGTANMPSTCQEFLQKQGGNEDVAKTEEAATALVNGEQLEEDVAIEAGVEKFTQKDPSTGLLCLGASEATLPVEGLGHSEHSDPAGSGPGLIASDLQGHISPHSLLQAGEEVDNSLVFFFFILLCVCICILCTVVGGMFFRWAFMAWEHGNIVLVMLCLALGGLVVAGAWCMAWPVGVIALVVGLAIGWETKDAHGMMAEMASTGKKRHSQPLRALFASTGLGAPA